MKNKKYTKSLLVSSVIYGILVIMLFLAYFRIITVRVLPILSFLPGDTLMMQMTIIFLAIAFFSIIGSLFSGLILAPLYLLIHKHIIGTKLDYAIQIRDIPEQFRGAFKSFFPSLMAINFAMIFAFSQQATDLLVNHDWLASEGNNALAPFMTFIGVLVISSGISMAFFSPVWYLSDAGIVYTNEKKVENRLEPVEVRAVAGWYHYLLKGYAGISVIITYFLFMFDILDAYGQRTDAMIPAAISLPILPFVLTILVLPAFIILDATTKFRQNYIRKFARKIGITKSISLDIQFNA